MGVYRNYFLASRPWSLTMSFISVSVGTALAAIDGAFYLSFYIITLFGMFAFHLGSNLLNDYFDVRSDVDSKNAATAQYRPHPLIEGKLTPKQVLAESLLFIGITLLAGLYLTIKRGWPVAEIALIGIALGVFYTAPPFKFKYFALGELSVFLIWGPLVVEGAYFVQQQTFSMEAFWISLPFGSLVALVLLANNLRDVEHDKSRNICTLPILLGKKNGIRLYIFFVVFAYLSIMFMSICGPLALWSLIILASAPLAYKLLKEFLTKIPIDADARTAQLDTIFGSLLIVSLLLEVLF